MTLLLLLACSIQRPTSSEPAVFPHPEGYLATHSRDAPTVLCLACHDDAVAPSCASCHPSYPHEPGWRVGVAHGADTVGCELCHTAASTTAGACTSCHASFPHPPGFAAVGAHGVHALRRGGPEAVCGPCHGATLTGGERAPSCASCHAAFPHPEGFASAHGNGENCAACHGEQGHAGVSCARCHEAQPHPADFRVGHLERVEQVGEPPCLSCHAPGDGGPVVISSCSSACHGG